MKPKTNGKTFEIRGVEYSPAQIIEKMGTMLTPERKERISQVVEKRTYDIVPVMK